MDDMEQKYNSLTEEEKASYMQLVGKIYTGIDANEIVKDIKTEDEMKIVVYLIGKVGEKYDYDIDKIISKFKGGSN